MHNILLGDYAAQILIFVDNRHSRYIDFRQ
jgi:hypothetical protein